MEKIEEYCGADTKHSSTGRALLTPTSYLGT
jgi:hypothetical protein